jgi:hypothetical protein
MIKYLFIFSVILLALIFSNCSKDDNSSNPNPTILKITKIVPDSGYIGDVVSITGKGFGATQDTSIVLFNGTKDI